jgi:serine/threonine-protein kinase
MTDASIAHYRITGKLGEGGMGEVYRATDTKLNRDVALKVLPESFARDPERMARFGREAQVLAALNHPNIAAIHGVEESEGKRALVMELVEGETLQDRIERGPIPVEEALPLARQMAEGLEEAHERGIIHRDLKPANVKTTATGTIKILDFGLGKALEDDTGMGSNPDLSQSPTMNAMATRVGVILGTAGYMSPEQARGRAADRRSDVWSFGVVFYEMLTGKQAFGGQTVSDVLASVLRADLSFDSLPKNVPPPIVRLLRRCLERDPKQRLQSIGEARITITDYLANPTGWSEKATEFPAPVWRRVLPWALATASAIAAVVLLLGRSPSSETPLQVSIEVAQAPLYLGLGSSAVLSPDGTRVVVVSGDDNARSLRLRALGQLAGVDILSGSGPTGSPYNPFFSHDGNWVGYVTASELRKVPISGGASLTLTKVDRSRGASWAPDDTIIFAPNPESALFRVSAAGGEPSPLTTLDEAKGEATHRWPQVLPGGDAVLFTSHTQPAGGFDDASVEIVMLQSGERKSLLKGGSYARYVPSGHLVYASEGTLFAVPFDLSNLEVRGIPAPVVQNVAWSPAQGGSQFSFSDDGRLMYVAGENTVAEYPIIWVNRDGGMSTLLDTRGSYANPRLSPDGEKLSLTVLRDGNWDIWVYDLDRGVPTRLTFDESQETEQLWSPDGKYLAFSSNVDGQENLYRKLADGSGEAERLTESQQAQWATSWSQDGRHIAYINSTAGFDIEIVSLEDRKVEKFLGTPFSEADPAFSPDGRFIAYDSNESGRTEVYVRPFPASGGKWQVSDGGGAYPAWSGSGRELFYRTDTGIMVASIETSGDTFRAGKPRVLFEGAFRGGIAGVNMAGNSFADFDVTADGQRFVMFPATEGGRIEHPHVTLVTHWFDALRTTFAAGKK